MNTAISAARQLAPEGAAAFMGAFFAFIFVRYADSIKEAILIEMLC